MATGLLVVAGLVGGGGCSLLGRSGPRPVAVVGDSLSVLGEHQIRQVLETAGWKVSMDGYPGVTTATQMPALEKTARAGRHPVVIELGTNDAHALDDGKTDAATERSTIGLALALFAPGQCLVWVNADANPSRPGGSGGRIVNDSLTAAAAGRPGTHIADLNAMLQAHPEYLLADGVHLTDDGSTALGHLMADALDACG